MWMMELCEYPGCARKGDRGRHDPHLCTPHYEEWLKILMHDENNDRAYRAKHNLGEASWTTKDHRLRWLDELRVKTPCAVCDLPANDDDYLCEACRG
jgi:hypothetical protein